MIALIARMKIKEGEIENVIALFRELAPKVREEEGTLAYAVCRDKAAPNSLVVVERYRDDSALQAHGATPYFKEFSKNLGPYLEEKPELTILDEVISI